MVKRAEQEKLIQKAVDVVDSQKLVDLTIELTNIASPTGQEGEIARTYFERLEESGMRSVLQPIGDDRYNALGVLDGEGGGRSLMYNGHLDTSFGDDFSERGLGFKTQGQLVDDEWIFGMGTFNMKNALAAYIIAVDAIRASGIKLGGDLLVAAVAGEIEKAPVEGFEGANYQGYGVGTKHLVTHGGVADACIVGEPTNMKLVAAHCGSSWVKIIIPGELVHTAWADHEDNAIMKSRIILDAIDEWIDEYRDNNSIGNFSPKVNVAAIDGGWSWRGARSPDSCSIFVDIRTLPDVLPTTILRDIKALISRVNSQNIGLNARAELYVSNPGTSISDDHELISCVSQSHLEQLGVHPEMSMEVWCSDASHMNRYGVPSINYGAAGRIRSGGEGWSTQQGEHVHIGDLTNMAKIYVRTAAAWCGVVT